MVVVVGNGVVVVGNGVVVVEVVVRGLLLHFPAIICPRIGGISIVSGAGQLQYVGSGHCSKTKVHATLPPDIFPSYAQRDGLLEQSGGGVVVVTIPIYSQGTETEVYGLPTVSGGSQSQTTYSLKPEHGVDNNSLLSHEFVVALHVNTQEPEHGLIDWQ